VVDCIPAEKNCDLERCEILPLSHPAAAFTNRFMGDSVTDRASVYNGFNSHFGQPLYDSVNTKLM